MLLLDSWRFRNKGSITQFMPIIVLYHYPQQALWMLNTSVSTYSCNFNCPHIVITYITLSTNSDFKDIIIHTTPPNGMFSVWILLQGPQNFSMYCANIITCNTAAIPQEAVLFLVRSQSTYSHILDNTVHK
jgi:hypothetical protein